MIKPELRDYFSLFIDETKENLQAMNSMLLVLEANMSDISTVNDIFRFAHTVKGMSSVMGFNKMAEITHKMEDLLDAVRTYEINLNSDIVDAIFKCFDTLTAQLEHIEATEEEPAEDNSKELVELLVHLQNNGEHTESVNDVQHTMLVSGDSLLLTTLAPSADELEIAREHLNSDNTIASVLVSLSHDCMLKSARSFIVLTELDNHGIVLASTPSREDILDEKFGSTFELLYSTTLVPHEIVSLVNGISEVDEVVVQDGRLLPFFNQEQNGLSETDVLADADEPVTRSQAVSGMNATPASSNQQATKATAPQQKQTLKKSVRVDIDRLDNLMNLVSELIIIKTRLDSKELNEASAHETIEYLERITTNLHDAVMKVRMVPVESTFNKFPRTVRDVSKDLGKQIKLVMSGQETEVDRTVIDEISDPLLHLIRNSIDHGIELPEKRVASGKPAIGTINLRAYPDGNTVVIEVEDDGAGIDVDKVVAKAVAKGVISQKESEGLSNTDAFNLLFAPGFSTAEVVTDLSGRGVGLDVVKSKIEAIKGTVEVRSILGQGSKFIIRLPLTLAIIQALMTTVGNETFAIPINNIKELTVINDNSISLVQDTEVTLYRGKTLPLIRLDEVLEVSNKQILSDHTPTGTNMTVVIVRKSETEVGLIVDGLKGQQEIVIKTLGSYLANPRNRAIAGATILGNGSVALILDPNQLF